MEVKLPNLGEGADSGTVVSVLVKAGAAVKKGQNLIELETGKAVAPIPSPAAGTVERMAVKEGDKLTIGQLILELATAEASQETAAPTSEERGEPAAREPARPAPATPSAHTAQVESGVQGFVEQVVNEKPVAGPYPRRVARDLGIDLRYVTGSGKSGQIRIDDLKAYVRRLRELAARPRLLAAPPASTRQTAVLPDLSRWGPITRKPVTQLRKAIAERMVQSATTIPAVTQFDEADVTELNLLREKRQAEFEGKGARLTLTTFVLRCVANTLKEHPVFNSSFDEAGEAIVFKEYIHLGLAVDTEQGLLVPVIRDADRKDLVQLSKDIQDVATKARERKLSLEEMQGGTFTISNQGGIGGRHFTPIINTPEVAILGLGRGSPQAVVRDGKIVSRTMMPLALTYDHRVIDGAMAARFMVDLVVALQNFRHDGT
jgi:pyruvate dehydrogenase E2 component (dihydrolipoamide acetyltransferase)